MVQAFIHKAPTISPGASTPFSVSGIFLFLEVEMMEYSKIIVNKMQGLKICKALAIAGYYNIMKPVANNTYELWAKCDRKIVNDLYIIYRNVR